MKKKYLSLAAVILSFAFVISAFTGCTAKPASPAENTQTVTENSKTDAAQTTDENSDEYEITYGESYTAPEAVAAYIYEWEELPPNYITKNEAEKLGWQSNKGNLWQVADGKSIGGDKFGNREGLLPEGENYRECDVNYAGGYRDAERLVYSTDDFDIYYTADHYESFEQVYDAEDGFVWNENIVLQ
ncbi:MAG: ribonuclease [Oscillospiraceae bacterium]|nr:ribonuclease [Oscillospiraceae bacterium]